MLIYILLVLSLVGVLFLMLAVGKIKQELNELRKKYEAD